MMTPQESPFDYINRHYGLNIKQGTRVLSGNGVGRMGTVLNARGPHVLILLDGDQTAGLYHPTWQLTYMDEGSKA